jgi:hypothetical protein
MNFHDSLSTGRCLVEWFFFVWLGEKVCRHEVDEKGNRK